MKPSTKYQMMFMGEMRPVVSMWNGVTQVYDPGRAAAVVLYLSDEDWATVKIVHQADIVLAPRSREGRTWEAIR